MDDNQPDLFGAIAERDEALRRVGSGSWSDFALEELRALQGLMGTAEDFRLMISPIVGKPHHHNAWGALIKKAVSAGVLVPTGQHRQMRTKRSHARQTPVYRVAHTRPKT
jgi:hypothetical protein